MKLHSVNVCSLIKLHTFIFFLCFFSRVLRRIDPFTCAKYFILFSIFFSLIFLCREFRLLLREDPSSIFTSDIQIENTEGPLDFDVSRIYTGVLEGKWKNIFVSSLSPLFISVVYVVTSICLFNVTNCLYLRYIFG